MEKLITKDTPFADYAVLFPVEVKRISQNNLKHPTLQKAMELIDPQELDAFIYEQKKQGKKTDTLWQYQMAISHIFRNAVYAGILQENPCRKMKKIQRHQELSQSYSDKEIEILSFWYQYSPLRGLFFFLRFSGLIEKEALELRWKDVDFNRKVIHIRKTEKTVLLDEFRKTGHSRIPRGAERTVPLSEGAYAALLWEQKVQKDRLTDCGVAEKLKAEDLLVFTDNLGRPLTEYQRGVERNRIAALSGIKDINFMRLRVAFIHELLESGVNVKTMNSIAGLQPPGYGLRYLAEVEMKKRTEKGYIRG